jgi:hypothetical protein
LIVPAGDVHTAKSELSNVLNTTLKPFGVVDIDESKHSRVIDTTGSVKLRISIGLNGFVCKVKTYYVILTSNNAKSQLSGVIKTTDSERTPLSHVFETFKASRLKKKE